MNRVSQKSSAPLQMTLLKRMTQISWAVICLLLFWARFWSISIPGLAAGVIFTNREQYRLLQFGELHYCFTRSISSSFRDSDSDFCWDRDVASCQKQIHGGSRRGPIIRRPTES